MPSRAPPISNFGAAAYDKPRPPFYDPAEVRRLWELIVAPGQVVEVRVLNATTIDDRWPQTYFGYFDDVEKLIAALPRIKSASGIYFTPNPLLSAILPRSANRLRKAGKGGTTSDKEVVSRSWLLLDLDAIRPSGVSSSDSEHAAAMERARMVRAYLSELGWPDPIEADSGNGAHLMYRIYVPAADEELIKRCLAALAKVFDDADVKIDQEVFNPARIWKLYGSLACKGDSTIERPHRIARILNAPDQVQIVSRAQLESLVSESGRFTEDDDKDKGSDAYSGDGQEFDLTQFIERNGFDVNGPHDWKGGGQIWEFNSSPMCEHHDRAAFVGTQPSGAIVAGCHHDSCSWGWPELHPPNMSRSRTRMRDLAGTLGSIALLPIQAKV